MAETHETIADIIEEYRQRALRARKSAKEFDSERVKYQSCKVHPHCNRVADMLRDAKEYDSTADRLEAALKRELAAPAEKSSVVGDAAKLRVALEHLDKLAREFAMGNYYVSDFPKMLRDVIQAALAEPPRNCDVGTAEEQYQRFMNMCNSKDVRQCAECSMRGFTPGCSRDRCFANWAQMPYEEGGVK